MPQVCSEKSSLGRKLWLQERMANLEVVPRKRKVSIKQYCSVHDWLKSNFTKPKCCFICRKNKPLDWACIGKYENSINNFICLCRSCHLRLDFSGSFTHCKRGHLMTKENTYSFPEGGDNFGQTRCRACQIIAHNAFSKKPANKLRKSKYMKAYRQIKRKEKAR